MSDEEAKVDTKADLERAKRMVLRSLKKHKDTVAGMINQNPSFSLVNQVQSYLDLWSADLVKLNDFDLRLLNVIDYSKATTAAAIEKIEVEITQDYEKYTHDFGEYRGKLNAISSTLETERRNNETLRHQSLNSTFQSTNPLAKLPDIKVPPFNGDIKNYTNWQSLFTAIVDSHEGLGDIQKLYYLKTAMVGDAENLLSDYPLTEGMYQLALGYVKKRYFNKRAIIAENFRELLNFPTVTPNSLRKSIDQIQAIERGLKTCGIDTAKMSPLIAYIVGRKLPDKLREDWENSVVDYSTYPSLEPMLTFLSNRCFAYETIATDDSSDRSEKKNPRREKNRSNNDTPKTTLPLANQEKASPPKTRSFKCLDCGGDHQLIRCDNFDRKNVTERYEFVKAHKLCQNCLKPNHLAKVCNASGCRVCGMKHSTKLHRDQSIKSTDEPTKLEGAGGSVSMALTSPRLHKPVILLPCAVVRVQIADDRHVLARAFIDGCSQSNLISEAFVRRHRLITTSANSNIAGVGPMVSSNQAVELTVASQYNNYSITFTADVIGRLPYEVTSEILRSITQLDSSLKLADKGVKSTEVDILIGAEFSNRILSGQKKFIGETCFEFSKFGWIVSGPFNQHKKIPDKCCCLSVNVQDALSQFWEVEEVNPPKKSVSEFELCEAHFKATHTRLSDGRFQVRLPFKSHPSKLANTYAQARAALLRSETELKPEIRAQYVAFMKEYRELGHMKPAGKSSIRYYIPHLAVLRPESTTTKLRVVFHASAKNRSGVSLNDILLNGDEIQPPLFDTLSNFRKYLIAFSADISMMYRQISMHPDDRPWQTILWRDNPTDPIEVWELWTLTYGERTASYIAKRCLKEVAQEVRDVEPEVADAIEKECVMDDMLTGANTVAAAIKKQAKIHSTLLGAKFPLRKYVSNSPEFLQAIDPELKEELKTVSFSSSGVARILGLQWNPKEDVFQVFAKIVDISNVIITKRVISSLIASVYDPLGFVGPVLILGKILLQDLWREELDWDEPVPTKLALEFTSYYQNLSDLSCIKIPRAYPTGKIQFFGFCDASIQAYGAVLYARSNKAITIVCAKSKVAPIKPLTIPRLELVGATLLVSLVKRMAHIMKINPSSFKLFCDSTTVLAWIKGPASKYETFVRNRIDYINSIVPVENWSYVKSADNPADLLTHGLSPKQLSNNPLWLSGPKWLQNADFDSAYGNVELPNDPPEQRQLKAVNVTLITTTINEDLISRYSSLDKLLRIVKLVITFANHLRKKPESCTTRHAANAICQMSQAAWFAQELADLFAKAPISTKSHIASLDPFLDPNGIMRVGGRLSNSNLPYDSKYPIVLHCKSNLAKLLVKHAHETYCHATHSFVLAYLQRKYYLIHGGMKLIRSIIKRCVYCTRMRAQTQGQIMGDLPTERTSVARPFTTCGVDFAGPFTIRCTNHRSPKHLKYYASFFVCMVTRAVHIEAVADLSTEAFLSAFQRFIARRGIPKIMWSDNGTNFVGAANQIAKTPAKYDLDWKFIPPRSPHHGGIWEAAVKAGKRHLLSVMKNSVLTEEQFKTVLTSIEAILNSRPLYRRKVETEIDAIDVITPGHFLIQSDLLTPDTPDPPNISLFEKLGAQRQLIAQFWLAWKKSYLSLLQRKSRWTAEQPNLQPNDIVLIKEQCSPLSWPLARVMEVLPDRKGRVRIVRLRAKGAEFTRSIQQIVKLPVDSEKLD